MKNNSRRKFLQQTALAAAGLSLPGYLTASPFNYMTPRPIAHNDQINLGVIGCKGMGWANIQAHLKMPEVNCIALADIDQRVLDE